MSNSNNEFITPSQTPRYVSVRKPSSPINRHPVQPLHPKNIARIATRLHAVAKTRKNNKRAARAYAHAHVKPVVDPKRKHMMQSPRGHSSANLQWRRRSASPRNLVKVPTPPRSPVRVPTPPRSPVRDPTPPRSPVRDPTPPRSPRANQVLPTSADLRRLVLDPRFIIYIYGQMVGSAFENGFSNIGFNPQLITLVGGSALTIYDSMIFNLKARYSMGPIKEYIQRDTQDIDLTWWPNQFTIFDNTMVAYVTQFVKKFNETHPALPPAFGGIPITCISDTSKKDKGIIHITVICPIVLTGGLPTELCDLSIHDSQYSQSYNEQYVPIRDMIPRDIPPNMTHDPMYCNSQNTITPHGVRIPSINAFIRQQLFAFGAVLLYTDGMYSNENGRAVFRNRKGFVYLRRLLYIKYLLSSVPITNLEGSTYIQGLFQTPNRYEMAPSIQREIENRIRDIDRIRDIYKITPEFNQEIRTIIAEFDAMIKGKIRKYTPASNVQRSLQMLYPEEYIPPAPHGSMRHHILQALPNKGGTRKRR